MISSRVKGVKEVRERKETGLGWLFVGRIEKMVSLYVEVKFLRFYPRNRLQ